MENNLLGQLIVNPTSVAAAPAGATQSEQIIVQYGIDPNHRMNISPNVTVGQFFKNMSENHGIDLSQISRVGFAIGESTEFTIGESTENVVLVTLVRDESAVTNVWGNNDILALRSPADKACLKIRDISEGNHPDRSYFNLQEMFDNRRQLDADLRNSREGSPMRMRMVLPSVLSLALFIMFKWGFYARAPSNVASSAVSAGIVTGMCWLVMANIIRSDWRPGLERMDRPLQSVWNSREIAQREADVEAAGYEAPNAEVPDAAP